MADNEKNGRSSAVACESHPAASPDDPAGIAIRAALARGERRVQEFAPAALRGEAEGVHRLRTTARRLRSEFRTFRDLLDEPWARPLEDELKWLGGVLGAVRDIDDLTDRLRRASGKTLGALGPLFLAFDRQHASASQALRDALQGDRFRGLLRHLADAAATPRLLPAAEEPCRDALPPLVAASWKKLRKRGRGLGADDPDESFHEVRKRAKRARHAAEAVAGALDESVAKAALQFAKLANAVQDVLGEHQDAIVAARQIGRIAADHPSDGPFNLAAGRLLESQERAADESRSRFFKIWKRLDRKKNRLWLKP